MGVRGLDMKSFIFGGTASVFAEFGTFPLDTTKTRLMVQGQRQTATEIIACKYRGMFHTFYTICTEEGKRALYKGLSVALLRQATYGTVKIGVYESLKPAVGALVAEGSLGNSVLCAAAAGVISSCVATPTDVLKVRQQASGLRPGSSYRGSLATIFGGIYREEGLRGLWRGVGPTAQRAALVCGVQLPTYEAAKRFCVAYGMTGDNPGCHLLSSILAGIASAVACNPIDVVKNRMMNQRVSSSGVYTGAMDCALQTCRAEGFRAFWKGLVPNCMRLGPWNMIFFMSMEQMKQLSRCVPKRA